MTLAQPNSTKPPHERKRTERVPQKREHTGRCLLNTSSPVLQPRVAPINLAEHIPENDVKKQFKQLQTEMTDLHVHIYSQNGDVGYGDRTAWASGQRSPGKPTAFPLSNTSKKRSSIHTQGFRDGFERTRTVLSLQTRLKP